MIEFDGVEMRPSSRPAGTIVARDNPRQEYRSLVLLSDGRWLIGYKGSRIGNPSGVQVRHGTNWALQVEVTDIGTPLALHDDSKHLLGTGPLCGGYEAAVSLVDLEQRRIVEIWPVCKPFAWLPGSSTQFVAQSRFTCVDQQLVERHQFLREHVDAARHLVVIDTQKLQATTAFPLIDQSLAVESVDALHFTDVRQPYYMHLAYVREGNLLLFGNHVAVGAYSLTDARLLWTQQVGWADRDRMFHLDAMAISNDGKLVAVGGANNDWWNGKGESQTLVVLDAATGETVLAMPLHRLLRDARFDITGMVRRTALAWHPLGWLAVGAGKTVAHVRMDGTFHAYNAAQRNIHALLFLNCGAQLLVAGAENHLRVWDMLDNEVLI
jgi:hypothetical protein